MNTSLEIKKCQCDRNVIYEILGECFLKMEVITQLPLYLTDQIKNAKSAKQALNVLKLTNHEQNKREKIQRQRKWDNIRTNRRRN